MPVASRLSQREREIDYCEHALVRGVAHEELQATRRVFGEKFVAHRQHLWRGFAVVITACFGGGDKKDYNKPLDAYRVLSSSDDQGFRMKNISSCSSSRVCKPSGVHQSRTMATATPSTHSGRSGRPSSQEDAKM